MSKTVPFQTFLLRVKFNYIWPLDSILSGTTTLGYSEPGSDGNEEVLHISQISIITGTSPSDCFGSYPGHSLEESYPSAEMQSEYSAPTRQKGN